jgi:hypothetical protein
MKCLQTPLILTLRSHVHISWICIQISQWLRVKSHRLVTTHQPIMGIKLGDVTVNKGWVWKYKVDGVYLSTYSSVCVFLVRPSCFLYLY